MDAARPALDVVADVAVAHSQGATPACFPEGLKQLESSVRRWDDQVDLWETPRSRRPHTYSTRRVHPLLRSAPPLRRQGVVSRAHPEVRSGVAGITEIHPHTRVGGLGISCLPRLSLSSSLCMSHSIRAKGSNAGSWITGHFFAMLSGKLFHLFV